MSLPGEAPSAELRAMLTQLATLEPRDRDFVLGELGEAAEQQLIPLIEATNRQHVSAGLADLIAEAKRGNTPNMMTDRAAQTLAEAAKTLGSTGAGGGAAAIAGSPQSFAAALWRVLGGGR